MTESQGFMVESVDDGGWELRFVFGKGDDARDSMRHFADAYRTGKLVLIDDGAVERMARALSVENSCNPDEIFEGEPIWRVYEDEARAALSALGVKP